MAANVVLHRSYAPRPFVLLRRVPILRHCDAFVTNFTVRNDFTVKKLKQQSRSPDGVPRRGAAWRWRRVCGGRPSNGAPLALLRSFKLIQTDLLFD
ncbi:hypothetical protein EVAR_95884_1 [Eumeta japonica]|uniref:Uncharacterized protein n=1 Tax=Eumeta variegata TaxID=151549 RepID=A0A4C1VLY0_EUMVA|nr:hypothetical protein EVAR_95884_1 [Eumeta japonica]